MMKIRLVLAEDQSLLRSALATLLSMEGDFDVVGTAGDGKEALAVIHTTRPDIVLTDIEMPGMTGLDLAATLRQTAPRCKVIIVTTFGRAGYLRRALQAGVSGYLLKDTPSDELVAAVRRVAAGHRVIDPELALAGWEGDDPLTDRERQALRLAGEGMSSIDIAQAMSLSEGTVRNYLSEAIGKLGAANRIEAARLARAKGWL